MRILLILTHRFSCEQQIIYTKLNYLRFMVFSVEHNNFML